MLTHGISSTQWSQSQDMARAICGKVFRSGGKPADALRLAGAAVDGHVHWGNAIDHIAASLCARA